MGVSKTENFTQAQNDIATLAKALGHPERVAIIEYLLSVETCITGDIVEVLPLAQPTVSQHLKELKNAGLIKGNVEGTSICYCIEPENFNRIKSFFDGVVQNINNCSTGDCC